MDSERELAGLCEPDHVVQCGHSVDDVPHEGPKIGEIMGFMDDAKDTADATAKKAGEVFDDAKERVSDKVDEVQADAEVKKAEAHRDAVDNKNDYKEQLRQD